MNEIKLILDVDKIELTVFEKKHNNKRAGPCQVPWSVVG